ncbi:hypothetical protein T310_8708, partial [Rasamsonia emersonii CBS 393.64]
ANLQDLHSSLLTYIKDSHESSAVIQAFLRRNLSHCRRLGRSRPQRRALDGGHGGETPHPAVEVGTQIGGGSRAPEAARSNGGACQGAQMRRHVPGCTICCPGRMSRPASDQGMHPRHHGPPG